MSTKVAPRTPRWEPGPHPGLSTAAQSRAGVAMTQTAQAIRRDDAQPRRRSGPTLFFRRWLANPLQMGSVIPSSSALCQRIVAQSNWGADEAVLELGAGTGVVSRALLAAGLPPSRL